MFQKTRTDYSLVIRAERVGTTTCSRSTASIGLERAWKEVVEFAYKNFGWSYAYYQQVKKQVPSMHMIRTVAARKNLELTRERIEKWNLSHLQS
ncbi:MAG: hypothetical protein C9356_20190 [Oleiphilus sp.]|nr:MAG: hypothetical protein C9356_20190 [Oleiphilus sp.]